MAHRSQLPGPVTELLRDWLDGWFGIERGIADPR
jgi:hypothetical protein